MDLRRDLRRDGLRRDLRRDGICDATRQPATRRDSLRRDATACDATPQPATRRDSLRRDATACDATRQPATRRDSLRRDATRRDATPVAGNCVYVPAPCGELGELRTAAPLDGDVWLTMQKCAQQSVLRADRSRPLHQGCSTADDDRTARVLFDRIDRNGDGGLTRAEVIRAVRADAELRSALGVAPFAQSDADGHRAFEEAFQLWDADGSRDVSQDEFAAALRRRRGDGAMATLSMDPPPIRIN
eukprot:gene57796-biopygen108637